MKIKNIIAQIINKRHIKWVLVFLVLGSVFVSKSYAGDLNTGIDEISWLLNLVISMLSWVWIILANLAGKLMTNDFVYGSFLHLDSSLWTLWNIMKNFANFALGFLVLVAIVKSIFNPFGQNSKLDPKKIIVNSLMAGILIQMSWFLMGAVIDVSTIMTSAIGSFPSQFMSSNSEFQGAMMKNIGELNKGRLDFNPKDKNNLIKWTNYTGGSLSNYNEDEKRQFLDTIMPRYDSVSGPLLFLGLSVFDFGDFSKMQSAGNEQYSHVDDWGDLFLELSISGAVLIIFSVMMFLIFILNLFRILLLRIIIPMLPIIILLRVFQKDINFDNSTIKELTDIRHIFMLIFKPVLMVGSLSIVLIILILIKNIIKPGDVGNIPLSPNENLVVETVAGSGGTYNSIIKSEGIMEFSMGGVKDTISDIIMYLLGLFLIFFIVKMTVNIKTGISFVDNSVNSIFKTMKRLAGNIPIVPIPGGGGVGFGAINDMASNSNMQEIPSRILGFDTELTRQRKALGLEDKNIFEDLSNNMEKNVFVNKAVQIGVKNFDNFDEFMKGLKEEKSAWENKNNGSLEKELRNQWNQSKGT